MAKANPQGA